MITARVLAIAIFISFGLGFIIGGSTFYYDLQDHDVVEIAR